MSDDLLESLSDAPKRIVLLERSETSFNSITDQILSASISRDPIACGGYCDVYVGSLNSSGYKVALKKLRLCVGNEEKVKKVCCSALEAGTSSAKPVFATAVSQ